MIYRLVAARSLLVALAFGCGSNCPEPSNSVFPAPQADDTDSSAASPKSEAPQAATEPVAPEDCGIPIGASKTEIVQRFGQPDATSEPQEVSTEYHYYGKLLVIYVMNRVDDVILEQGANCPE